MRLKARLDEIKGHAILDFIDLTMALLAYHRQNARMITPEPFFVHGGTLWMVSQGTFGGGYGHISLDLRPV
jgi:hypothetical protein